MLRRSLAPCAFFGFVCSVAFALYSALSAPPGLEDVRELLIARRYAEAATAASERLAAAEVPADEAAELRFLVAHAKLLQGDRDGGRAALEALIAAQPTASWSSKARFELADLERAQGRHEPAAKLFRERVAALIAPERKGEVAAIYRRFATEALAKEPPDLARARAFYDLAAELGLPAAEELAVRFAAAEIAERQADWGAARQRFAALREKHGDGEAGKLLYHLSLAELRSGQASAARAHFEDLLRKYTTSPHAPEALHGIAASFGFPQPPSEAALERGASFARRVIAEHPRHPLAAQSAFELGEAHFHLGRTAEAAAAWQAYVQSYGTVDDARTGEARVKIGECAEREQRFDEAIAAWKVFLGAHPFHPRGTEILQRIASAELERAGVHARAKRWDEARAACEEWLARYPLDPRAQDVLGEIGALERAAKRFDAAIAQWERVAGKFPGTEAASLALYRIGETQELDLQQLERAVATYRRCNFGASAGAAALRLRALEEQTLALRTPRVYRSNEKVLVELATRNLEKLRVRIYALDLPSYFDSKRGIGGVENLDIEIIQPTRTFDFAPALYAKHKEIQSALDLEVSGTGAWVVKVDDGRTEATVLALRSDLQILSRATKQDLVVYVEDALAGRAAADVPLFVADGAKLLFEGRTDEKGLFYRRDAKLRDAAQLAIFAPTSEGSAFSGLEVSSLATQGELQPKGYLLTDRGVYEPGEVVHAHAFVREVKDGVFAFEAGVPWTLEWLGPDGALLASRALPLGALGSLQDRFELGTSAALGAYSLRVRRGESGPVFTQAFEVRRFERKAMKLELEVPNAVLYRGEPVRGTAIARFFHGGPAAERRIAVLLSDGTQREGRTDAAGRFAFEFATTDLLEEQELALRATLLDEGVGAEKRLRLAVNALVLELSTLRELYVAGESFDLELRARDPLGAPQQVAAELAIYRVVEEDGVRSERLEREEKLATDAKGEGRLALALRAGGSYRLRATALDRFGNRIHAKRELFISGEEDEVKLRLLSASDTLEAGVPSAVRVLSRLQPTRVLVTRLGDGIQSYEVRELARGEATWNIDPTVADAPRFALALAAIEGTKLHEAVKEFRVKRELAVTVEPLAARSAPGAEARAKVRVRSQRPLAEAEIVVGVVDEAYLALYPDGAPSIAEFFTGERALDSRSGSSCGFESVGRARPVPQALLAEEQRRRELLERQSEGGDPQSGEPGGTAWSFGDVDLRLAQNRESDVTRSLLFAAQPNFRVFATGGLAGGGGGRPGMPPGSGAHDAEDGRAKLKDANGAPATQADDFYLGFAGLQKNRADAGPAEGRAAQPNEPELRADFRATAWFGVVPLRAVEGGALEGELGFELPDSTTSWQWTARALDRDASGGEARATSIAKLPLEVRIDAPRSLVEGDRVRVRTQARNTSDEAQRVRASLRASGALTGEASAEPTVAAGGEHELSLDLEAQKIGSAELRSELRAETTGDAALRTLEVRPNAV
ncbi:MAG: tetratricopeptide repeat protein, partial [Planctomycetes bacterium]|nr:tetratricopeptide repeat protein [Planctomycetota bacterium]